jgi:hypothetical protein
MLAMVVNDDAGRLRPRGVLAFLASMLAPTETAPLRAHPVGASMLAMVVNDDAGCLDARVALGFFASVLAPTGSRSGDKFAGKKKRQPLVQSPQRPVFVAPVESFTATRSQSRRSPAITPLAVAPSRTPVQQRQHQHDQEHRLPDHQQDRLDPH